MRRGVPTVIFAGIVAGVLALLAWAMGGTRPPVPAVAGTNPAPAAGALNHLVVMTANVRIAEPEDGVNIWPNRRALLVKTVLKSNPDLLGCQEVTPAQGAYLIKELAPWYTHYPREGVGTIEGETGSRASQLIGAVTESFASLNTLFYRTDRFDQVDGLAGLVLPDRPQANPSENTFFTLAVLKEKNQESRSKEQGEAGGGGMLIVVDTHIRHGQDFAVKCALKIRANIAAMLKKYPGADVIVMGDMNHNRTEPPYRALAGVAGAADGLGVLTDTFDYSKKRPGELWGNWHAFTGRPQQEWPTDLIFTSAGWKAKATTIVRDGGENGLWPSDHFFTVAELQRAHTEP